MSKDPGYSDSKKDTLESNNRFLKERNETLINKIEYLNQVNDGLHLLLKEEQNKYETLNAHDEMLIATVDKLKEENEKLRDALKLAVDSASFFSKFADCTKDSWACRCEFCRDTKQTKSLATARQVLKEIGEE